MLLGRLAAQRDRNVAAPVARPEREDRCHVALCLLFDLRIFGRRRGIHVRKMDISASFLHR
jgi:hypothetical protein